MKKVFQVVGAEFKRSTDREYTHAICWIFPDGSVKDTLSYCGSALLAEKALRAENNRFEKYLQTTENRIVIKEVVRIK